MLDFSRIEAGRLELQPEPILLSTLITRIFTPIPRQKHLVFDIDCPTAPDLAVFADVTRIRQILVNLLGNAFKFTTHGTVAFRLRHHIHDDDSLNLRFEIQDSGIGIPPDRAHSCSTPSVNSTPPTPVDSTAPD
ncbi:MAG: hypothetical protein J6386_11550 [Candidatus Synoicihabitans palmerolidicus]|nr:hypothetical protein [Candidatus Synoicihabitans palmerolidicus]